MKSGILIALVAALVAIAAPSANAYDRQPVTLGGFTPDGWGNTISNAESNLHRRYAGIATVYCIGIIMRGYASVSSWISGVSRLWDKFLCPGRVRSGGSFSLIYDQKSAYGWTIYNLRGVSLSELHRR